MKASELRIGNIIEFMQYDASLINSKPVWKEMEITYGDHQNVARNPNNYRPLKINEDWLLRFGFKKDPDGSRFYLSPHECSTAWDFVRMVYDTEHMEFIINSNPCDGWNVECKYVHTLQNLYFALTREELEIKDI